MTQKNSNALESASKNFNVPNFVGTYTNSGQTYYQNNTTGLVVKVCERKEPTALKPRLYLVERTQDGRFPFLSSLYPRKESDTYTAEIGKVYFIVELVNGTLKVSAI
jgi:hypothetical protein